MIYRCAIREEDDNEKKWEVLCHILLASSQHGVNNSQLAHSTHDESCCVWLQVAGVSHSPAICSRSELMLFVCLKGYIEVFDCRNHLI